MKHGKKVGIFTVLSAVIIALGGCSSGFTYSSGDSSGSDNEVNNSSNRVMSMATAENIFSLIPRDGGLEIASFKNTTGLVGWLLSDENTRATVSVDVPDSFTIPANIGGMQVVEIADKAFGTENPGSTTDISTVVSVVELPSTITRLGSDLFEGIQKKSITLKVPDAVVSKVGVESIVRAAGEKAVPKNEDGNAITPSGIAVFKRPQSPETYTLSYYNDEGAAKLNGKWYNVLDPSLKNLFKAIYEPNKPGSLDSDEKAINYTEGIGADVLALFAITIGATAVDDKVELKGIRLPSVNSGDANFIVVDIGLPGDADNSQLPAFYIPREKGDTLGDANGSEDYSDIRLRVNKGAKLVILADNGAYTANGAGHPCPEGNFKGGCVEVMAGGYLRDGAFEGFPLGAGAVIVNRAGSYLSVGPEPTDDDAKNGNANVYAAYYAGYLLGPAGSGARVEWNKDSNVSDYLEVRSKQIATNAKLTAKKNLGLICSVWFVGDAKLTVNITETGGGLWANERKDDDKSDYNFYSQSATIELITISSGILDKRFLIQGAEDLDLSSHTISLPSVKTINGKNTGIMSEYGPGMGIIGYLVTIP
jgi:hypothetical protein